MIVARFTPATGWAGKSITYESGQFVLEGYGSLVAQDVLDYDRQGQLAWEYDGLREWAGQMVAGSPRSALAGGFPAQSGSADLKSPLPYGYAADERYIAVNTLPSPPGLALAGLIINAVMTVLSVLFLLVVFGLVVIGLSTTG